VKLDDTQYGYHHTHINTQSPNLSNTLFSKVRQQVLGLLYSRPDQYFHTNEIIRLTNMDSGDLIPIRWTPIYAANAALAPHSLAFDNSMLNVNDTYYIPIALEGANGIILIECCARIHSRLQSGGKSRFSP